MRVDIKGRIWASLAFVCCAMAWMPAPLCAKAIDDTGPGGSMPDYDIRLAAAPSNSASRRTALEDGSGALAGAAQATAPLSPQIAKAVAALEQTLAAPVEIGWDARRAAPKSFRATFGHLGEAGALTPSAHALAFVRANEGLFGRGSGICSTLSSGGSTRDRTSGMDVVELFQAIDGLEVLDSRMRFYYDGRGRLIQVNGAPQVPAFTVVPPARLCAADAVRAAARSLGVVLEGSLEQVSPASGYPVVFEKGPFRGDVVVSPLIFPLKGRARPCWSVLAGPAGAPDTYSVLIDAGNGALLRRTNLTDRVQTEGLVFVQDPITDGFSRPLKPFVDDSVNPSSGSPLGWSFSGSTIGNNAEVREDWFGDDEFILGSAATATMTPGPPARVTFGFPFVNDYASSGGPVDLEATLTNVFYHVNYFHDYMHAHGFDEASGNFQTDNLGAGGAGSDPVRVDVQDSLFMAPSPTTRNLTSFTTPPDGQPGRLELFGYDAPNPRRDPGLDTDTILHELTHGMSERLVGGPGKAGASSCLTGLHGCALAEGWSDFAANHLQDDPVFGQYLGNDPSSGLRSDASDANAYTLGDFCQINFIVPAGICRCNNNGEIWTGLLWDLRELLLIADPSLGRTTMSRLLVTSMKLAPCNPTFLDLRAAMLAADLVEYDGQHHCLIWQAFADRGMGAGALIADVDDNSPVEDFLLPPECGNGAAILLDRPTYPAAGSLVVTVADGNLAGNAIVTLSSSIAGDTLSVSLPPTAFTGTFSLSVPVSNQAANPANQTLEVDCLDTITASYDDQAPIQSVNTTASVACTADIDVRYRIRQGDCDSDEVAGFDELQGFLDPAETAVLQVIVRSNMPWPVDGALIAVESTDPAVHIVDPAPVSLGTLPAATGSAQAPDVMASFEVKASPLTPAGTTVGLDVLFAAPGYTGSSAPTLILRIGADYMLNQGLASGVEDFESGAVPAGWSTQVLSAPDEWRVVGCLGGTLSLHDGAANCNPPYNENSETILSSQTYNFTSPVVEAYRPVSIDFDHAVGLGSSAGLEDTLTISVTEASFPAGDIVPFSLLTPADNTAGAFSSDSIPIPAGALGGFDLTQGFRVAWSLQRDGSASSSDRGYFLDNFLVTYDAVQRSAQAATCADYYTGTLGGCAAGSTLASYNIARPGEMQTCCEGGFFEEPAGWSILSGEFPTPASPGEDVVLIVNDNPRGGAHPGIVGVNRQSLPGPVPNRFDFGQTQCVPIPAPVPSSTLVGEGTPITLTWPAIPESGSTPGIIGYLVYRIDAELYPPASSTIEDYTAGLASRGVLVGSTVGQGDINMFQETAPSTTTVDRLFTYVIQPVFDDGAGVGIPATFAGSETSSGLANISPDSAVVTVENVYYVDFDFYRAVAGDNGNEITWGTRTEVGTAGFYVLRGVFDDPAQFEPVNQLPVTPQGSGSTYTFTDASAPCGQDCYYQILELVSSGEPSRTEIFQVERASRSVPRTRR